MLNLVFLKFAAFHFAECMHDDTCTVLLNIVLLLCCIQQYGLCRELPCFVIIYSVLYITLNSVLHLILL